MHLSSEPQAGSVEGVPMPRQSSGAAEVPWAAIAWFAILLLVSYFSIFKNLAIQWSVDEDVSHGFFVPLVAGYIAWQKRHEILSLPMQPNYLGAFIVLWGSVQLVIGSLGALASAGFIAAIVAAAHVVVKNLF